MNATEAARRAGYRGNDNTLASTGAENLTKPAIADAIKDIVVEATKAANVTIEKVLRDLEEARQAAFAEGQYAVAVRSSELQGKYLKMFTERIEHSRTIDDVSDEELTALIRELSEKGALDGYLGGPDQEHGSEEGDLPPSPGTQTED